MLLRHRGEGGALPRCIKNDRFRRTGLCLVDGTGLEPFPAGMALWSGARARLCYGPPGGLAFVVGNGASRSKRQKCGQKCGQMCGIIGRSSAPEEIRR